MRPPQHLIDSKHIVARRHSTEPLTIYNYTERCQFAKVWDEHTTACRGLIIDDDGRVVARPYRKFFNFGDPLAGSVPPSFVVQDKLDGALGISYREPSSGLVAIATRGSFESEQAKHATELWRTKYAHVEIPPAQTWLFEIIYPYKPGSQNRHVIDYGPLDDLVLHGVVDIETGADLPWPSVELWPGQVVETWAALPPDELPVRANAEGYVLVEDPLPVDRPAHRIKIKFEEYTRRHRLMDGITPHRIWECVSRGDNVETLIAGMPDEFFAEAVDMAEAFKSQADQIHAAAVAEYHRIGASLLVPPDGGAPTRKEWAIAIHTQCPEYLTVHVFNLLSGKPVWPKIWKAIEP